MMTRFVIELHARAAGCLGDHAELTIAELTPAAGLLPGWNYGPCGCLFKVGVARETS